MKQYAPLRVPLNKLLYTHPEDMAHFEGLTEDEINSISKEYSQEEIRMIGRAVISACEVQDVAFLELLPELKQRHYTHEQVAAYLLKIKPAFVLLLKGKRVS